MIKNESEWRRFVLKALVLSAMVMVASFVGNKLASAREGVANNAARSYLTVTGTLTGVTGTQTATFRFYRAEMGGEALCSPVEMVTPSGTEGVFSVDVRLDQENVAGMADRRCPDTLFDGSNVYVEVWLGTPPATMAVARRPINPVPYAHYASVAGQYGTPDCPVGYRNEPETGFPPLSRLCVRRQADGAAIDQVVRVGRGSTAFWIDRYEAVVSLSLETAQPVGTRGDDYGSALQDNGEWTVGRYALSVGLLPGNSPSRFITWFQANTACRLSGKRLPTGDEWLMAAQGTADPLVANDGTMNPQCNTGGPVPRSPGLGTGCVSAWGAQDMIGNVTEWTAEWYAGLGNGLVSAVDQWPIGYAMDGTWNIQSGAYRTPTESVTGVPAAALRGGEWASRTRAGIFSLQLDFAPSGSSASTGFRCVIPR